MQPLQVYQVFFKIYIFVCLSLIDVHFSRKQTYIFILFVITEIRVNETRRYKKRAAYQEMSCEKKQALLMKNRATKQLKTRDSSNNPKPNALARSNILLVSETPLQIDVASSAPHDATKSLHGNINFKTNFYNFFIFMYIFE